MDPLSDVLSLLKPRSYACGGFDTGGDICMGFPRHDGIKCYAVVSGAAWLAVDGEEPVQLAAGDCFILPRGRPFRLASDLALPPTDFRAIIAGRPMGVIGTHNGGGDCTIVGGHFALDGRHADILLGALPPIVHIRAEADKAALRWSLDRMMLEIRMAQPGGHLVVEHLAQMMLVQALRLHMAEGQGARVGWLFALADRQIGAAIGAMHGAPARRWTLQALASAVGMSRTSFALRFRQMVGSSAMDYLTRWRMLLAGDRLVNSRDGIADIAASLGYDSESAFGTAFKRVMGCSPRQYGRSLAPVWHEPAGAPAERRELVAV